MHPVKLKSTLKDYLWGGTRLKTLFNKKTDYDIVAESWELSCHKDGVSIVDSGEYQGRTLIEYIEILGRERALGKNCEKFSDFPILIKFIDAHDSLSVQVHPDNEYALRVEGEYGKTEMWYIIDAEPGASLIYGFREPISKNTFRQAIKDNTFMEFVNRVPVKKGDMVFIEAGTLHAIGPGILIAEIQQNSNSTYRVYDFGRVGADGKPRALHIDKAVDVTNLGPPTRQVGPSGRCLHYPDYEETLLSSCEYFTVKHLAITGKAPLVCDEFSFRSILCLSGEGRLLCPADGQLSFTKGESIFIPAIPQSCEIIGECEVLITYV